MTSSKSYFFYGVVDGELPDDTWKVLHEHFEKLMKEENGEFEFTNRKATGKKDD
jgi:hypothetical protein